METPTVFNAKQGPDGACLFLLIMGGSLVIIGLPFFLLAVHFLGVPGFFGGFLVYVFAFQKFTDRWLKSKVQAIAEPGGIRIEVLRAGLGIPKESLFTSWEQVQAFRYDTLGRGRHRLILLLVNDRVIGFQEEDTRSFYQFLKAYFPEKEKTKVGSA